MPLLLEDLAEETSASNRRTADRLDAETRELERLGHAPHTIEGLHQRIVESARSAADFAISRLPQAEALWRSALAALPTRAADDSAQVLRHLADAFEACQRFARSSLELWNLAAQVGISPEGLEALSKAEQRFDELAMEARRAVDHRTTGWQPTDPERFARGLRLAREGRTVKADEARAWFRPAQTEG